jgi:hypothetical protein
MAIEDGVIEPKQRRGLTPLAAALQETELVIKRPRWNKPPTRVLLLKNPLILISIAQKCHAS